MYPVVILLSLAVTLGGIECFSPMTVEQTSYVTFIRNFRWPADANRIQNIHEAKRLQFVHPEIEIMHQNFTDRFKHCTVMQFYKGRVSTVVMNTKLQRISLSSTATESFVINRGQSYALEILCIEHSKLTRIPDNIDELDKLRALQISRSHIKFILMDEINGLKKLEQLDFSNNQIQEVDSYGTISLPNLSYFDLSSNLLQHVDVCSWDMPSIEHLRLDNNKLSHLSIGHLSDLSMLELSDNPLNCAWTERLLNSSAKDKLESEISCDKQSEGDFTLECPFKHIDYEDRLRYKLITQWRINSDLHDKLNKIDERMSLYENRISELTKQLNETTGKHAAAIGVLKEQSTQQYNVANDIIEAMYRIDIQRSTQEDDILDLSRNVSSLAEKLNTTVDVYSGLGKQVAIQNNTINDVIHTLYLMDIGRTFGVSNGSEPEEMAKP